MTTKAPTKHAEELRGKAFAGFFWSYGATISGRVVFFVATLGLARLLAPSEFGLVAFAVAILSLVDNLSDLGVGQALVYSEDGATQEVASTAFWITVAGAFGTVALVWSLAPLLTPHTVNREALTVVLVLCLQFPLRALGRVHWYQAIHALEFRKLTFAAFLSDLVKALVAVGLAVLGLGVWSLVIGQLASTLIWSLTLWFATGWRPSLVIGRSVARRLVRFGLPMGFIGIVGYASQNTDYVIVGARLGAEQLGFYSLAFRIPEVAILEIFVVLQTILFPYFSRLKDAPSDEGSSEADAEGLKASYRQALRTGSIFAFPLGFGMAALALPLVLVVYGREWEPSIVPLALISIWCAFAAIAGMAGTMFKALGRGGVLTTMATVEIGLTIPTVWFVAPFGISAVAAALICVKVVYMSIQSVAVRKAVGVPCFTQFTSILRGFVGAILMAAVVYPISKAASPLVALAVGVPVGAVVYVGILRAFFPEDLRYVLQLVPIRLRRWRRRPPIAANGTLEGGDAG